MAIHKASRIVVFPQYHHKLPVEVPSATDEEALDIFPKPQEPQEAPDPVRVTETCIVHTDVRFPDETWK